MANSGAGIVCLLLILLTAVPSLATDYTVGDSSGWALGVDYSTWAKDKTFKVGDKLVFKYDSSHSVDEVKSADYSSCTAGNSISTDNTGSTTIPLKTAGTHYFICGVIGHCSGGMKLAVTVDAGSSPPSGTGATTSPTTPTTPSGRVPDSSPSGSVSPFVAALFSACVGLVYKLIVY